MLRGPRGRRGRTWATAAVAATFGLVAAACTGGDDAASVTTAAPAAPAYTGPTVPPSATADGVLRIGALLPLTGSQAHLGPAAVAAAELAVADLNAAGGVLGQPVELEIADSGDVTSAIAADAAEDLLAAGVDVIVGPTSTGVADAVVDRINDAGVVLVAPANPLPVVPAGTRYLRVAAGEALRGRAVADQLLESGARRVTVLSRRDPLGQRLAAAVGEALEGGGASVTALDYNPESEALAAEATKVMATDPQAVVLVGFGELTEVLAAMVARGTPPSAVPTWLLTDRPDLFATAFPEPGALTGLRTVVAGVGAPDDLAGRIRAAAPDAADLSIAAEVYDAVVLSGLAALQAGSDDPVRLPAAFIAVTGGDRRCEEVAACVAELSPGAAVGYVGRAGEYRFDTRGDRSIAPFQVLTFGDDNRPDPSTARVVEVSSR